MSAPLDLDALLPDTKAVKFGGREYAVPGALPLVTFLKVNRVNQEREGDQLAAFDDMVEAMVQLFCWHLPESDTDARTRVRTEVGSRDLEFLGGLLGLIYPADLEDDEAETPAAEADGEVPPPTGGTTTS